MISLLNNTGAEIIIYDVLFAYSGDTEDDNFLVNETKKSKNVIFPVAINFGNPNLNRSDLKDLNLESYNIKNISSFTSNYNVLGDTILPLKSLANVSHGLGHINANRDGDGVIRRVPLLVKNKNGLFPSLAFSGILKYLKITDSNVEIKKSSILCR